MRPRTDLLVIVIKNNSIRRAATVIYRHKQVTALTEQIIRIDTRIINPIKYLLVDLIKIYIPGVACPRSIKPCFRIVAAFPAVSFFEYHNLSPFELLTCIRLAFFIYHEFLCTNKKFFKASQLKHQKSAHQINYFEI